MPELQRIEPGDPRVAAYLDIADDGQLRREGLFVAEGRLVVRRLLREGRYRVRSLLLSETARSDLADALATLHEETAVYVCATADFLPLTGFNLHRGCLALAERTPPRQFLSMVATMRRAVVLEAVGNPDNLGGVFRNAAAFGVDGVLLSPACGDPFYRKAIRTSMGATLRVPFARVSDWPAGLGELRRHDYVVAAFTPSRDAIPLADFAATLRDHEARLAVLFGSEGAGLSEAVLQLADVRVRVPIDPAVDSLNLAVAAGIVLSWLPGLPG